MSRLVRSGVSCHRGVSRRVRSWRVSSGPVVAVASGQVTSRLVESVASGRVTAFPVVARPFVRASFVGLLLLVGRLAS